MAGLSCALSGASCCVPPTYFEASRFLSGYCGALCFIFCQVIIKDGPDIYSSFSSSTECLNLSHHITFVTCMSGGISGSGGGIDTGQGNIQPMMCIQVYKIKILSSSNVKIHLVIVFIYKDPISSRLSRGKKVVNEYFSS